MFITVMPINFGTRRNRKKTLQRASVAFNESACYQKNLVFWSTALLTFLNDVYSYIFFWCSAGEYNGTFFWLIHFFYISVFLFIFQDASQHVRIVVALYPFKAIEGGDLSLEKVYIYLLIIIIIDAGSSRTKCAFFVCRHEGKFSVHIKKPFVPHKNPILLCLLKIL